MSKYRFEQIVFNSTEKKKPIEEDKYTYVGLEHLDPGSLQVTRYGSAVAPIGEKLIMREGDVLFGKRRAYQKKVAVAPFDGIFSAHGMVLRPKEEVIDKNFFPLFISSDYFLDAAIKISVGSLSPTINWRDLKELEFELPEMDKQRELAKVLWAMDVTKNSYQKLLQKTDELVKSQFIEMFGDPLNNTMGWPVKDLNEICDVRDGTHDSPSYVESGYPLVTSKNVVDGKLDLLNVKYITKEDFLAISKRSKVDKGDIIMPMIGTIGKPLIISTEPNFAIKNVALIKFNKTDITNVYIQQLLSLSSFLEGAIMAKSKGITQKFIALGDIRKLPIPVPPIEFQIEYVSFIQQSDKSKFELEQALAELLATYKKIISENLS